MSSNTTTPAHRSSPLPTAIFRGRKRIEIKTLLVIALVAGGCWVFLETASAVQSGDTHAFDETVLLQLRTPGDAADPIGPHWVEELMRDLTALGGVGILAIMVAAISGYLAFNGRWRATAVIVTAVVGGIVISTLLKMGYDRPRPALVPHGSYVYTKSFPSGHSMMATTTYLTLGALLARLQRRRAAKIYVLGLAIVLAVAVGLSRVYLGVHWPTDVLAGWAAGATWAIACWVVLWRMQVQAAADPQQERI